MRRLVGVLIVAAAAGCGYGRVEPRPEPAPGSFTAAETRVTIAESHRTVKAAMIGPEFFPSIKAQPMLGRTFAPQEFVAEPRVVMVSESLWSSDFKRSPEVIGQTIMVNGRAAVIVGVVPGSASQPEGTMVWLPRAGA